ncbi:MAG TPA: SRPBCC family protein [Ilumatobacter sp.]|nr:SRPBCC family protein [Ilumatobacter sp.]
METVESIVVDAALPAVFAQVERLDAYPAWLPLVHTAEPAEAGPDDVGPAWTVELRAKVGPFARSKRLRMERVEHVADTRVVFARRELDGREHAMWRLQADLREMPSGGVELTMHLSYGGSLWTGGLLERVLDDQVRQGREGLHSVLGV